MDWMKLREKALGFLAKYKFVILVLLLGLVLMAIPSRTQPESKPAETTAPTEPAQSLSEQLTQILSQVEGAGKVRVMLTVAVGEETIFQTDEERVTGQDSETIRRDTILVTDAERTQSGLVRQVNPPTYLGAIVICQGADSPAVRLAIVDAVSRVTGLGADRISVLKMK